MVILLSIAVTEIILIVFLYNYVNMRLQDKAAMKRLKKLSGKKSNKSKQGKGSGKTTKIYNKKGILPKVEKSLMQAGISVEPKIFLRNMTLLWIGVVIVVFASTRKIVISLIMFIGIPILIIFILNYLRNKRVREFSIQLLDIVNFLSSSLKSGYSLMQALNLVVEETSPPASTEFNQVLQDINLGKSYQEAFDKLVERNPIEEVEIVARAIIISRESGGNLGQVLNTVSNTIVEKDKIKGEVKSLTAQGRISGIVVSMLPVGVLIFMLILNPSYIKSFIYDPLGQKILLMGVVSQAIGGLLIKKIVKIDW